MKALKHFKAICTNFCLCKQTKIKIFEGIFDEVNSTQWNAVITDEASHVSGNSQYLRR